MQTQKRRLRQTLQPNRPIKSKRMSKQPLIQSKSAQTKAIRSSKRTRVITKHQRRHSRRVVILMSSVTWSSWTAWSACFQETLKMHQLQSNSRLFEKRCSRFCWPRIGSNILMKMSSRSTWAASCQSSKSTHLPARSSTLREWSNSCSAPTSRTSRLSPTKTKVTCSAATWRRTLRTSAWESTGLSRISNWLWKDTLGNYCHMRRYPKFSMLRQRLTTYRSTSRSKTNSMTLSSFTRKSMSQL